MIGLEPFSKKKRLFISKPRQLREISLLNDKNQQKFTKKSFSQIMI